MTEDHIDTLTSRQRAFLRSAAHHLKPVHHVGKEGVTPAAIRSVQEAFNTRELLKVKVLQEAPVEVREAAEELAAGVPDTIVVQTIGRTAVLYRPDPEKPEIRLPS
jgi:RNA-binding protein